jgi:hypothetical protein
MTPTIYFHYGPVAFGIWFWGDNPCICPISPFLPSTTASIASTSPQMDSSSPPLLISILGQYRVRYTRYLVSGSKSPPSLGQLAPALHHRNYPMYPTIRTPTMSPAFYFYHGPVPRATHSVFGFGVKIPAYVQSRHSCPPPPHLPYVPHHTCSHHAGHLLFLSRASTECNALSIWFQGENPHRCWIGQPLPSAAAFTLCTSPYVLPPCPPPSISIMGQYRAQHTRYLVSG